MSNIVVLTNHMTYPYHKKVADMITSIFTTSQHIVKVLDVNSTQYPHQCLAKLTAMEPEFLITLDLAGFHFRTQSGENALNMLFTKNLNLVWGNPPEYTSFLTKKISLSMLFYDATGIDNKYHTLYPNVLYYKAQTDFQLSKGECLSTDKQHFQNIWEDFQNEVS